MPVDSNASAIYNLAARLPLIRAKDAVLGMLQSTFAQPNLMGGTNPYLFVRDDPKASRVWVCDPDAREQSERSGSSMIITVQRGDYVPGEHGMLNSAGGDMASTKVFTDLAVLPVFIMAEATSSLQSEILAGICYSIIKLFRSDMMREFDLANVKLSGISAPAQIPGATGSPWLTTVSCRIEIQEFAVMTEMGNELNRLNILAGVGPNVEANFGQLLGPFGDMLPPPGVSALPPLRG